ncbi:methyl-accepting chemotaxis protein [Paenibacillus azoreducens]|uniref:Methyl-accepting chemotaxis protein n=1 Tax=Paenibacillus azoreducens TaxID=116718 RepID=A0A919Y779_9BACL|nr:methyl-accepting chemotaxis protein [Paenibacillus azoreducens]GIO45406.1 methyl-accepting chemotaxis protein [Paenibacillus azoreducens]
MLKSIRMKLILAFLAAILIPITIIGVIVHKSMVREITDTFVMATSDEISQVDKRMALFFDTTKENVKYLADTPIVHQADNTITTYMNQTEKQKSHFAQNGGIESKLFEDFERFAKAHPNTSSVFMATSNGGYVQWPEKEMAAKYDPRTRPWYKDALAKPDEVTLTEPYVDSVTGELHMSSVSAVKDQNGKTIGVIGLDTTLGKLAEHLKSINIKSTGYVVLLSNDGTILAHPQKPELISKNIADIGVPELADIKNKSADYFRINLNDKDYMANLFSSKLTGWKYLAFIEESELTAEANQLGRLNFITSSICALLSILLALGVASSITKPIKVVVNKLKEISAGDFTGEVPASVLRKKDEIGILGQSLQAMQNSMRQLVGEVRSTAKTLAASSEQLSEHTAESTRQIKEVDSIVKIVAAGAETQMRGTEEGSKAMEEMATGIQHIAESAASISETSLDTTHQANQGNMLLQEAVRQMDSIAQSVRNSGEMVQNLEERSEQMAHIVDVITQIASQTNLLALNAAIEASRAGEQGRGFAVVAQEVRKLAERSAASAHEIAELIDVTKQDVNQTVKSMELVRHNVADGIYKVQNSGETIERILTDITEMSAQIQDTSAVTQEMSAGSEEVLASVNEIAHIAEKNSEHAVDLVKFADRQLSDMAALVKNAEQLNQMAQTLSQMIDRYKL